MQITEHPRMQARKITSLTLDATGTSTAMKVDPKRSHRVNKPGTSHCIPCSRPAQTYNSPAHPPVRNRSRHSSNRHHTLNKTTASSLHCPSAGSAFQGSRRSSGMALWCYLVGMLCIDLSRMMRWSLREKQR